MRELCTSRAEIVKRVAAVKDMYPEVHQLDGTAANVIVSELLRNWPPSNFLTTGQVAAARVAGGGISFFVEVGTVDASELWTDAAAL